MRKIPAALGAAALGAVALALSAAPARAQWKGPRFSFNEKTKSWTLPGGKTAQPYQLYNPDNNLVAVFSPQGGLETLFDNYPDFGGKKRKDDVYLAADSLALGFLASGRAAPGTLTRQVFADGVRTLETREGPWLMTERQFLSTDPSAPRALVERYSIVNAGKIKATLSLAASFAPCLAEEYYPYNASSTPACKAHAAWDSNVGAVAARNAAGTLAADAGLVGAAGPAVFSPAANGFGATVTLSVDPGRSAEFAFVAALGASAAQAEDSYRRIAGQGLAGADQAQKKAAAAWHQIIWDRGAFKTGDQAVDALNYLKYVMNADFAGENGGFTAAKYGHPEIWARDSGYGSLSSAYVAPRRTRETLESAIQGGFVAGQDGTSMLAIASEHYARMTGDKAFLRANLPLLEKRMDQMWTSRDRAGMLVDRGGGLDTWRDWPTLQKILKGKANLYQQVLFSAALDRVARMLKDAGRKKESSLWEQRSKAVKAALNAAVKAGGFWMPQAGSYADFVNPQKPGAYSPKYDEVAHSLGVLWGIFPKSRWNQALLAADKDLRTPGGLGHADSQPYGAKPVFNDGGIWPFANFLEAAAQTTAGRGADFLKLTNDMSQLLSVYPAALPEAMDVDQTKGELSSFSTLWNSLGLYAVMHSVYGVSENGFTRKITLSPHIPWNEAGRTLTLANLPFAGQMVTVAYRVLGGGKLAVTLSAKVPGAPGAKPFVKSFTMKNGKSRTVRLPKPPAAP
ncbi:MAG TPA: hypothetical protein VNK24_05575 [Elusimicrobiota bacterium]|nr:hypothetical protein [Elusimicrobiota bacterium]